MLDLPDESVSEGVVGLTHTEGEETAVRVDPPGADTHRVPTNLSSHVMLYVKKRQCWGAGIANIGRSLMQLRLIKC